MYFRIVYHRVLDVDDMESHISRLIRLQNNRLSAQYIWRVIAVIC